MKQNYDEKHTYEIRLVSYIVKGIQQLFLKCIQSFSIERLESKQKIAEFIPLGFN